MFGREEATLSLTKFNETRKKKKRKFVLQFTNLVRIFNNPFTTIMALASNETRNVSKSFKS